MHLDPDVCFKLIILMFAVVGGCVSARGLPMNNPSMPIVLSVVGLLASVVAALLALLC